MKTVVVVFELEPSDPEHSTGLTTEHYDRVMAALASLGADEIDINLEDADPIRDTPSGGGRKKK